MDEVDIYADLDCLTLDQQVEQVQENNKELLETIVKLEETIKKFQEEISDLKKIIQNLERNISTLFKTAKLELERKDKLIADLRSELDDLKFKRIKKKAPIPEAPNESLVKEVEQSKLMINQKNRIIESLTKELENVKKEFSNQENNFKRSASHMIESEDLRDRLSKKRKFDDTRHSQVRDIKPSRSRSRSKSRDIKLRSRSKHRDVRQSRSRSKSRELKFDVKRTRSQSKPRETKLDKKRTHRKRSGSFDVEKQHKYDNIKYCNKSRSRSPPHNLINNNQFSDKNCRTQFEEKKLLRSRSRSSSLDEKKYHKNIEKLDDINVTNKIKNEPKTIYNNHLMIEDSGVSSSNSHTSELILKCDEIKSDFIQLHPSECLQLEFDYELEDGEIDCGLEDILSDEDNTLFKQNDQLNEKENVRKTNTDADKNVSKRSHNNRRTKKTPFSGKNTINKPEFDKNIVHNITRKSEKNPDVIVKSNKLDIENKNIEIVDKSEKESEIKEDFFKSSNDVLELTVHSNYLDDFELDDEISKMIYLDDDDKRKKRKKDKQRISKLKTAISECKQNIQLLEHNIYSDDSETEDEFNKSEQQKNFVLKISRGTIVKPKIINLKDEEKIVETNVNEISNKTEKQIKMTDNSKITLDFSKSTDKQIIKNDDDKRKKRKDDTNEIREKSDNKHKKPEKNRSKKCNEIREKDKINTGSEELDSSNKNRRSEKSDETREKHKINNVESQELESSNKHKRLDKNYSNKKTETLSNSHKMDETREKEKLNSVDSQKLNSSNKHKKAEKHKSNSVVTKKIETSDETREKDKLKERELDSSNKHKKPEKSNKSNSVIIKKNEEKINCTESQENDSSKKHKKPIKISSNKKIETSHIEKSNEIDKINITENQKCESSTKHKKLEKNKPISNIIKQTETPDIKNSENTSQKIKLNRTETQELPNPNFERLNSITENELLQAVSNIVDENFAKNTNLQSIASTTNKENITSIDMVEKKLNELFEIQNEKKEKISNNEEKNVPNTEMQIVQTVRKTPLKARRRRAFISIT